MSAQTVNEAEKMQHVPGIVFADGPTGRRARIGDTGIDVFEVIGPWQNMERDQQRLKEAFHWLTNEQLASALAYYALYPEEIDQRLHREESLTAEAVWHRYPFMRPR